MKTTTKAKTEIKYETIEISTDLAKLLREQAKKAGLSPRHLARLILKDTLDSLKNEKLCIAENYLDY